MKRFHVAHLPATLYYSTELEYPLRENQTFRVNISKEISLVRDSMFRGFIWKVGGMFLMKVSSDTFFWYFFMTLIFFQILLILGTFFRFGLFPMFVANICICLFVSCLYTSCGIVKFDSLLNVSTNGGHRQCWCDS